MVPANLSGTMRHGHPESSTLDVFYGPTLVFLLYQKGRDSRIFQAQDRAIDDFTLKGICAGIADISIYRAA